jgi:hypothetical protein
MPLQKNHGAPWLYDNGTGDLVGVKDPDRSEFYWQRMPHLGCFFSTQNQVDGGSAIAMTFNTTALSRGITLVDSSKIYVSRTAIYEWALSVHIHNDDQQAHLFELWGKKNNADIDNSRFIYSVLGSHGGNPGTLIPSQNFLLSLEAGDYVQIFWLAGDADVTIAYHPVEGGKPVAPSLLLTVKEISAELPT